MTRDRIFPAFLAVAASMAMSLCVAVGAASPQANRIVAVFPPWWSRARAMEAAAAAGDILAAGPFPSSLIVQARGAGLAARLRTAGVLMMFEAAGAGGCGTSNVGSKS